MRKVYVKAFFLVMKRRLRRKVFSNSCGLAAMILVVTACAVSISDYNKELNAREHDAVDTSVDIVEEKIPMAFDSAIDEVEGTIDIVLCHDELDMSDYCSVINMNSDEAEKMERFKNWEFFEDTQKIDVSVLNSNYSFEIIAAVKYLNPFIPASHDLTGMKGMAEFLTEINKCEGHFRDSKSVKEDDCFLIFVSEDDGYTYLVIGRKIDSSVFAKASY